MADKPTGKVALAAKLLATLDRDRPRLERIRDYIDGCHDDPYMPSTADAEYKLLAKRSVTNAMPLISGTPRQALYVDNVRRGDKVSSPGETLPEWEHWQYSRLDSRQTQVHGGALDYGHSFTLTEKDKKRKVRTKGLSPLKTAALFEDPANDDDPIVALHVTKEPDGDETPGSARMWDQNDEYKVIFKSYTDWHGVTVIKLKPHEGDGDCPVTRFAAAIDLDGRTVGVIEPAIPLQNRINQTVFDLLVAQTYGSFKVRYVTGMAPPMQMRWVDAEGEEVEAGSPEAVDRIPVLDDAGNPVPLKMDHNARRFLFAKDPEAKFGSLDETPLGGYIESLETAFRQMAALSQTPPNHVLGEMANLSAEALLAAENTLSRKVQEIRNIFGESWERVFRLAAKMAGTDGAEDFSIEVLWRDTELRSMSQSADALGKLAEQLEIPRRGLWPRVPGATKGELEHWEQLREKDDAEGQLAEAATRASEIRTRRRQADVTTGTEAA